MGKRHESISIKQTVRLEWMQKTANLLLAGLDAKTIRHELHEFLSDKKSDGSEGGRGETSSNQVVSMLMRIWISPDPELVPFRDDALAFLREHPSMSLAVHWGMISAVYPFWFSVARQIGRLLALQDQITQPQIINRLKEQYGDRETISRYARYAVRSFVVWGVLKDSDAKGCYEKALPVNITDSDVTLLMIESALHATPEGKGALGLLLNNPAFFPFHLSMMTGNYLSQHSDRIDVDRYGLDEEYLTLKT